MSTLGNLALVSEADWSAVSALLEAQHGVVSRSQLLEHGVEQHEIRRLLRRREWAVAHPGVYVAHTGPLTWMQRAWSAVLYAWPAALAGESALRAAGGPGRSGSGDHRPIVIAVDRMRSIKTPADVVVRRTTRLTARAQWQTSPPRMRTEEAVLDLIARCRSELDVVALLTDVTRARLTTVERLGRALENRPRIANRPFVVGVLDDVGQGTCSVLEHGYVHKVARPHGLPLGAQQAPTTVGRPGFRDIVHDGLSTIVELDGRLGHDRGRDRDRDLERDLDALVGEDRTTVRLDWGQVFDRSCATAAKVGAVLRARGWQGELIRCPRCATK